MIRSLLARWRQKKAAPAERCAACPLTACVRGERASIVRMECAHEDACKLRDLGLYEGSHVTILDRQDGCLVAVRGSRLALAAKLADSITVLPLRA
jgi:Fe2+ transport system protein FeoA